MSTPITGVSSMATRLILGALAERYETASGVAVDIRSMGGVDAARLVRGGEATDLVVLASKVMSQLEAEGHLLAGGITPFTRSGMAVAIPAGADRPDISSEEAVRLAISTARKVGYSTGPSGDHLLGLCERWGLLPGMQDRMLKAPPGVPVASLVAEGEVDLGFQQLSELMNTPGVPVGSLVAKGEADLGFQQLSELIHVPGITVLGPLPPEIQAVTVFAAGVASTSARPDDTRRLIDYLASPETAEVKREQGMEPADEAV